MRSWYTAMPGETASCVGCHEQPSESPVVRPELAATRTPVAIEPWYGPARGFDFEREVQPVLDKYCVELPRRPAADRRPPIADLRAERFAVDYQGLPLSQLGASRLDPAASQQVGQVRRLQSLEQAARRPQDALHAGLRSPDPLHPPREHRGLRGPARAGEYHADTSELVQMLQKGHYGVELDREAWDRLITWIDLNGPCHGTWSDVAPIPYAADRRRYELAQLFGGPKLDLEAVPEGATAGLSGRGVPASAALPGKPAAPHARGPSQLAQRGWDCPAPASQPAAGGRHLCHRDANDRPGRGRRAPPGANPCRPIRDGLGRRPSGRIPAGRCHDPARLLDEHLRDQQRSSSAASIRTIFRASS